MRWHTVSQWISRPLLGGILAMTAPTVFGTDFADGLFEVDTFGTFGIARSSRHTPFYRTNSSYQYGVDDSWSARLDSKIGLQVTVNATDQLAFTGQVLARRNGGDEFEPELTWGYARWRPDEHFEVRLGRFRQSLFLITDSYDIGYSQPWVRPPVELYNLAGEGSSVDGIQVRYRTPLWGMNLNVDAHVGQSETHRPTYDMKNTTNAGLSFALIDPHLTLKFSLIQANTQLSSARVNSITTLIAEQSKAVAAEYATDAMSDQRYGALGLRYEKNDWLVMAELATTELHRKSLPNQLAGYVTVGHIFGNWTPYTTYAKGRVIGSLTEDRLTGAASTAANALLKARNINQQTLSAGVRWDVLPGIAIKAQFDYVRPENGAYGLQMAPLPANVSHLNVASLVMDWTF
jgi:hypothetical protein